MNNVQPETRFNKGSWWAIGISAIVLLLCLFQIGYRMSLPSEGWIFPLEVSTGEQHYLFSQFFENRPTPFESGDVLVSIEGQPVEVLVENAIKLTPHRPTNWQAGQVVEYVVLRDNQEMALDVELQPRSVWAYLGGIPAGSAWSPGLLLTVIIGFIIFTLRPGSRATQFFLIWSVLVLANLLSIPVSGQTGSPAEAFYAAAYWPASFFNLLIYPLGIEPMLIHLFLFFPVLNTVLHRWPKLTPAAIYGFPLLVVGLALYSQLDQPLQFWLAMLNVGFPILTPINLLIPIISLALILRTSSEPVIRAQARWLLTGFILGWVIGNSILFFLPEFGVIEKSLPLTIVTALFVLAFPISLAVAIFRYRLFDIDIIIRRTLIYGSLTILGFGIYFLVVGGASTFLQTQNNLLPAIVAIGLVAILFQPLRRRLQSAANRYMPLPERPVKTPPSPVEAQTKTIKSPSSRTIWLAWALCALCIIGASVNLIISLVTQPEQLTLLDLVATFAWSWVVPVLFSTLAALIITRQPHNRVGWFLMLPALATALSPEGLLVNPPTMLTPWLWLLIWFDTWSWIPVIFPIFLIPLHFPTGRPPSPKWNWINKLAIGMWVIFMMLAAFLDTFGPNNYEWIIPNPAGFIPEEMVNGPFLIVWGIGLLTILSASVVSLFRRYRRAQAVERQQIKWLLYVGAVFIVVYTVIFFTSESYNNAWVTLILAISILAFPVAIAIAILRYRLYDIEIIIRRTIIYGALTAFGFGIYILLVGGTSTLLQTQNTLIPTLVSIGLVAVLFQPLRRRLQTAANRYMPLPERPVEALSEGEATPFKESLVGYFRRSPWGWLGWCLAGLYFTLVTAGIIVQVTTGVFWEAASSFTIIIASMIFGVWAVMGALLVSRQPKNPIGWLLCLMTFGWGLDQFAFGYAYFGLVVRPGLLPGAEFAALWDNWSGLPFVALSLTLLFLLFPDGRPLSPRWRIVAWASIGFVAGEVLLKALRPGLFPKYPFITNPLGVSETLWTILEPLALAMSIFGALCLAAAVISLILRLRRAQGDERQQIKWFVYTAAFFPLSLLLIIVAPGELVEQLGIGLQFVTLIGMPIAVAIAIYKYRLYDIDIIIRRTLIYGALTALGFGIYFLAVGGASTLLQTQNTLLPLVVAVGVVALLFTPARHRLNTLLDRFMPLPDPPVIKETKSISPATFNGSKLNNPILIWLLSSLAVVLAVANLIVFFINWGTPLSGTWGIQAGPYGTPATLLYKFIVIFLLIVASSGLGLLIIIRRPRHPIGWLLYLAGLAYALVEISSELTIYTNFTHPGASGYQLIALINTWIWIVPFALYFWAMAIFPDGHLPSPRWRWVPGVIVLWAVSMAMSGLMEKTMVSAFNLANPLPVAGLENLHNILFTIVLILMPLTVVGIAALLIYRFRHAQSEERQQIKWLAGAVVLVAASIITGTVLRFILNLPIGEQFYNFSLVFLPLGIGIAILRYRLYDIDIIIRRTLIYGGLVAGLALAYFGSVALIQFMSQALTGPQSNLVVVAITLAIAALFNPVRTRFQSWIDRRFYREKVDARQALITFAREVRAIIDLPELLRALVTRTTELLHISHGAVFLADETGAFQLAESRNLPDAGEKTNGHSPLHINAEDLTHLQNGQPLSRPKNSTFPLLVPLIAPAGTQSDIGNPKSEILIGVLALGPRLSEQHYTREDQTLLTGLADQAGTAIYVAQLIEEKQAEAVRREETERRLESYRNSPAGRAEAFAKNLIVNPNIALAELHALTQNAGTDPDTAAMLEPLPAALTTAGSPRLAGLADGYRYLFAGQTSPELLPVGLRELITHLTNPPNELSDASEALALYQLCQHILEANSIAQIAEFHNSEFTTHNSQFLSGLAHGLSQLRPAAKAMHAYDRVESSQDKLAYLASAVERLSHADHLARTELGVADRPLIQRIAANWLAVATGAMSELQTRARLSCRLLTRHTFGGEIITLTLAVRNEGRGAALNVQVSLPPANEYTLLDEATHIEQLAAGEERQLFLRVRPRLAQNVSQFRAHFALLYDDSHSSGQLDHFADVVHLLLDEGEFQFIRNPYVVGTPLQSDSPLFFGRDDIIHFIQENLAAAHQNNLVLIGQRRTGKTSLLKQLPTHLGSEYVPIYLDGQSLALDPGLPNFFFSLATEITFALEDQGFELNEFFDLPDFVDSPAAAFERKFLSTVRDVIGQRHLLLLLDEFEELEGAVRRGNIDASIFGFLRHLIQHTDNLSVIFCGTHRMEELAADYWSVLFNISLYRHVAFLSHKEALRLIQEPVASYNMRYDDLALDKMWRISAGHPYFLQLLCHSLVNRHNKSERNYITVADVNAALDEILATGEAHFVYLWTESSHEERLIQTALSRMIPLTGQATPLQISDYLAEHGVNLDRRTVSQTLHHLTLRDILRTGSTNGTQTTDSYGWQLGLLGLWVEKYKSLSRVVDEV